MAVYRRAAGADRPAVVGVWQSVFGDAPEVVQAFLDTFIGFENEYVAESGGEVVAILSAVPCLYGRDKGVYFYALATLPQHRGEGVMAGLLAYAEAECAKAGARFSCLIPASASLFGYYKGHGYKDLVFRRLTLVLGAGATEAEEVELTAEAFTALRQAYLPGRYIAFSEGRTEFVLEGVREAGGRALKTAEGYLVYIRKENCLAVPELLAKDTDAATALLSAAAAAEGMQKAVVTLPQGSELWQGRGVTQQAAQYKVLDEDFYPKPPYLRFGLDELFLKDYENTKACGG